MFESRIIISKQLFRKLDISNIKNFEYLDAEGSNYGANQFNTTGFKNYKIFQNKQHDKIKV